MTKETIKFDTQFSIADGRVTLPHGIEVGGELVREVWLREMSGHEEDILADNRRAHAGKGDLLVGGAARITKILARCTFKFGSEERPENRDPDTAEEKHFYNLWDRMPSAGRQFALVCFRRQSVGDDYTFKVKCPECSTEIKNVHVDLSTLDVYPPYRTTTTAGKDRDAKCLHVEHEGKTPFGLSFTYKLILGKHEDAFAKGIDDNEDRVITQALLNSLTSINGDPMVTVRSIKNLSKRNRDWLRIFLDEESAGVDNSIEVSCHNTKCLHKFTHNITFGSQSFFFPSGA